MPFNSCDHSLSFAPVQISFLPFLEVNLLIITQVSLRPSYTMASLLERMNIPEISSTGPIRSKANPSSTRPTGPYVRSTKPFILTRPSFGWFNPRTVPRGYQRATSTHHGPMTYTNLVLYQRASQSNQPRRGSILTPSHKRHLGMPLLQRILGNCLSKGQAQHHKGMWLRSQA